MNEQLISQRQMLALRPFRPSAKMTPMHLNLIEIFASIQGETSFTGLPTTFIRLAACNLRCTWCDTTYSFGRGIPHTIKSIVERVKENGCRYVCVTGGEPLLQAGVHDLMKHLCDDGFYVSLETGGSLPIHSVDPRVHIILDIKCPGSGMNQKNLWENITFIQQKDEIKFVIADASDYAYAKDVCIKYDLFTKVRAVLFSPVFGKLDPKELVGWILKDQLPVRLNMQIHKFIWDPATKGV